MNRLARAQSPYLKQHATNPVDWHEWGADALELAKRSNKPILLSIGYSACHWCHVMERESFADPLTASELNADFVSIKVDREERPDLDKIYQLSHQLLSRRSGGWPLTVFLDPHDHSPIYTGTYFPPQRRHGLPAFREVLGGVLQAYRTRLDEIKAQNEQLRAVLDAQAVLRAAEFDAGPLDALLDQACEALAERFDERFGGFGGAPKFPHPGWLELLAERATHGDAAAGRMLDRTLAAMALSGLYDHLNGGFFRYSVDERFEIPHFEKMLYDNAQLLPLYAERAQQAPELSALFESAARGIRTFLDQELADPSGFYATALDADSEHLEGRYYVYSRDEVEGALAPDQASVAVPLYGLDLPANFEGHAWHLRVAKSPEALRAELGWTASRFATELDGARSRLKALRARRARPSLDYKLLTSCNALTASGLSRAGRALDTASYRERARAIVHGLSVEVASQGRLHAQYTGGTGSGAATLDDVALSLSAALEVLADEVTVAALRLATTLADQLISDYADPASGAFWYTAHDHEKLYSRPMQLADEALPSAYAVACKALAELGYWLAEPRWLEAAERALGAAQSAVARFPEAHAHLLLAMRSYRQPRPMLTVCAAAASFAGWRERLAGAIQRGALRLYLVDIAERELPAALAAKTGTARGRGYWCEGLVCRERIEGPEGLAALGL